MKTKNIGSLVLGIVLVALMMSAPAAFAVGWADYSFSGGSGQYASTSVTGYGSFYQVQQLNQLVEIGSIGYCGPAPFAAVQSAQSSLMTQSAHGAVVQTGTESSTGYGISINPSGIVVLNSTNSNSGVAVFGNGSGTAISTAVQDIFLRH